MNPQLNFHLETFDSDEEYSQSPALHEEEHVGPVLHDLLSPMDAALLKGQFWLGKFVKPKSLKELKSDTIREDEQRQSLKEHFVQLDMDAEKLAQKRKQVQDCRKEVSRLLGLVGAPPLKWASLETNKISTTVISNTATISVVKFLEAHVQFLLTVDQAFHYIQVGTSLHLGLGAQSQCVERVERAAIAREFRNKRRQSIGASLILDGVQSTPEPQRGADKSTLALASVRNHLAKAIVAQSDSLIQVWKGVRNATRRTVECLPDTDLLDIPDVVDLTWIKSARQQLASLLSHMLDHFCTIDCLHTLSERLGARSRLDESMWNVRNAREHLLCNLLLGKKPVIKTLPDPNDKLMLSLVQYREQLDALCGAIWACQQYIDDLPTKDDKAFARRQWWSEVKQLGATCRAVENEISQNFFYSLPEEEEVEDANDAGEGVEGDQSQTPGESGNFEHGHDGAESPAEKTKDDKPTKTMVFRGQGSMEEDRLNKAKNGPTNPGDSGGESMALPVRDTVSEQLLVKELQNRIETFKPEEEDDDADSEAEKAAKAASEPTSSHFLGASGSLLSELTQSSEPTSSHFLGASGSLLSELKQSIPATEQSEEEILGE